MNRPVHNVSKYPVTGREDEVVVQKAFMSAACYEVMASLVPDDYVKIVKRLTTCFGDERQLFLFDCFCRHVSGARLRNDPFGF